MRRISRGFTIIELLVVVAVIGILATITLIGFNRYQADTRDSQRSSQATIISEALERYYEKNGEYPSCPSLTASASTVTSDVLTGLEAKTLVAPQDKNGEDNSIKCQDLSISDPDLFAYVGDGSTACATGDACLSYTLKYKEESTGTIKTISSHRSTSLLTSGDISTLAATAYSFSQVNLAWTGVGGATSYNIQWHLNTNDFTTPTGTKTSSSPSTSVTGLTLGSVYYFRVQPATTSEVGNWSNVASATTYTLDTPVITATADPASPASQLKVTWTSVPNATSYSLQYSTSGAVNGVTGDFTTSPTTLTTTSPYVLGGLGAGQTRYFHVKSVASGFTSGWSSTDSAITELPAPVCNTSTKDTNRQITVSWSASAGALTYELDYASNSGFTGATTVTGITGTSKTVSSLNNGTTYYFRVRGVNGSVQSVSGACPSAATGVDGPTSVTWSGRGEAVRCYTCVSWMPGGDPGYGSTWWTVGMYISGTCQPGATVVTRLYAYYAYSNGSSANGATLMDWTWGTQERYVVSGSDSWYGWFQGWVACQVGSTRVGDTYLGNAGPY
jgi:prepilin-type N-terminal cleavage/methylation domain-containing protein